MTYNRHYCYRIDFADGFVYFGVRTCRCQIAADSSYTGSPKTHKAKWLTDTTRTKTIVSVHATRKLAMEAEDKLIEAFWAVSKPLSLNSAIRGTKFSTYGMKHTAEARANMSKAMKGKPKSAEHCAKIGAANAGKSPTEEHRAKLSKPKTYETCTKMSGKKWHTDGVINIKLLPGDTVPDKFRPGLTKLRRDFKWYTDGTTDIQLEHDVAIPAGFQAGRVEASDEIRAKIGAAGKGKKWYTNGANEIRLTLGDEIPEGFRLGRSKC